MAATEKCTDQTVYLRLCVNVKNKQKQKKKNRHQQNDVNANIRTEMINVTETKPRVLQPWTPELSVNLVIAQNREPTQTNKQN